MKKFILLVLTSVMFFVPVVSYAETSKNVNQAVQKGEQATQKMGWVKKGDSWYYFIDGVMQKDYVRVNGRDYYLGNDGVMRTGWIEDGKDRWVYANPDGSLKTGWVKEGNKWYYIHRGLMATGWVRNDTGWYYMNPNGTMKTGWLQESGNWYYLKSDGAMATGKHLINGTWYSFKDNGVML
ncbi:hypothetical protein CN354_03870 [Bacillus cereus]|nr:hypothetical protein CN354_03870 [Bacillus cereus]